MGTKSLSFILSFFRLSGTSTSFGIGLPRARQEVIWHVAAISRHTNDPDMVNVLDHNQGYPVTFSVQSRSPAKADLRMVVGDHVPAHRW